MNFIENFHEKVESFLKAANQQKLKMILVGGGAVNYHGYQRHSADLDFWIEISEENLRKLLVVLNHLNYKLHDLPEDVKKGQQIYQ